MREDHGSNFGERLSSQVKAMALQQEGSVWTDPKIKWKNYNQISWEVYFKVPENQGF